MVCRARGKEAWPRWHNVVVPNHGDERGTIRRGRDELDEELNGRPVDRVRLPGGGRPRVEKNSRASKRR